MSHDESDAVLRGGERKDEIKRAMYIMIVWITIAVAAGVLLVVFRDPFAGLFAFAPLIG